MFGMAWTEILVIMVLAAVLIGPKDIPKIMYTLGRLVRRFQYVKFAMSQQFDDILKAGDIEELRQGVNFEARKTDERAADLETPDARISGVSPDAEIVTGSVPEERQADESPAASERSDV